MIRSALCSSVETNLLHGQGILSVQKCCA